MIRRLIRILVAGFCLLSLIVSAGVAWLWWEYRHGRGYAVELAIRGIYMEASSLSLWDGERIGVMVLRDWPGANMFRLGPETEYREHQFYWSSIQMRPWQRFGFEGQHGQLAVYVRPDTGEPMRSRRELMFTQMYPRNSQPMRGWTVGNLPHAGVIAITLVPPLLWLGIRWRHVRQRRRRVRLGLCLACGYDLRAAPAPGRCPECGTPAAR